MSEYTWNIVEINCAIILLFAVFKLVQRYLPFTLQRFALLAIPVLATVAVCVKLLSVSESWTYRMQVIVLEPVNIRQAVAPTHSKLPIVEILYWIGVLLLLAVLLYKLLGIIRMSFSGELKRDERFTVIESKEQTPSSFFRHIYLPAGLPEQDRAIILQHEKIHARKLHSADRLYFEIVHCLCWFNPVMPMIKKELVNIHEFEVDKIMYDKYRAGYMEFLLAYSFGTSSSSYLFTNQFVTKLTLIKRIRNMKNKSKKVWIAAIAIPAIAGAFTLVSFKGRSENAKADRKVNPPAVTKAPEKQTEEISREQPLKSVPPAPVSTRITTDEYSGKEMKMLPPVSEDAKMAFEMTQPEFPGGSTALTEYFIKNIHYPEAAVKAKTTGNVYVSFIVAETGRVKNVTVKKGVSEELDAEAKRVVASMPDWIPAEEDGKKVEAQMILPVAFKL